MRSSVVVLIAMLVGGVPGVSAQALTEGARVRVTKLETATMSDSVPVDIGNFRSAPSRFTGTVVAIDEESVLIELPDGRRAKAQHEQIKKLEVVNGQRSSAKKGFVYGAALGAVAGGLISNICVLGGSSCDKNVLGGAAVGAAIWGGIGALVGLLIKQDRWEATTRGETSDETRLGARFLDDPLEQALGGTVGKVLGEQHARHIDQGLLEAL